MEGFNYVKDVPMTDQRGNEINGVGVLSKCGNFLVSAVMRPGQTAWRSSSQSAGFNRTIGFGDIEVRGFNKTSEPDENGFVEGEVGEVILNHTPVYVMQVKDGQGNEGEPFFRSISDYQYRQSSRGRAQETPFAQLLGDGLIEIIDEAINKSAEILDQQDEQGIVVRQTNTNLARAAHAFSSFIQRSSKNSNQSTQQQSSYQVDDAGMDADDIIPD